MLEQLIKEQESKCEVTQDPRDTKSGKMLTKTNKMSYIEGKPIKCTCGKLLAIEKDGKLFVYCKSCKRQIEIRAKSQ